MRVDEIIQTTIIYLQQKGVNTDEQILRRMELLDKFNTVRAKFYSDMIIAGNSISNTNYSSTYITRNDYSDTIGGNSYDLPSTIMGQVAYVGDVVAGNRFTEYLTIGEFQSSVKNQIPSETGYLRRGSNLLVDNTSVNDVMVEALCTNPYKLPTFNPDYDEYPVDEALIPQLNEALYQVYFSKIAQVKPDVKPDSTQQ